MAMVLKYFLRDMGIQVLSFNIVYNVTFELILPFSFRYPKMHF